MRQIRRAVAAVTLTAGLLGVGHAPAADAEADVTAAAMTLQGAGYLNPGLTPTGVGNQNFNWAAYATVTGRAHNTTVVAASTPCNALGNSLVTDTYEVGIDQGIWNCGPPLTNDHGVLYSVRAGGVMAIALDGTVSGVLLCTFQPDQVPPSRISSFHLACVGALA
jgi:hypothetical protein